jgi:hypothetical protein
MECAVVVLMNAQFLRQDAMETEFRIVLLELQGVMNGVHLTIVRKGKFAEEGFVQLHAQMNVRWGRVFAMVSR